MIYLKSVMKSIFPQVNSNYQISSEKYRKKSTRKCPLIELENVDNNFLFIKMTGIF